MIAEVFVPSFGALGVGGIISFVLGGLYMFDDPSITIHKGFFISVGLAVGLTMLFIGWFMMFTRRTGKKIGFDVIGSIGIASEDFQNSGWILVNGERWKAETIHPLKKGDYVNIIEKLPSRILKVSKQTMMQDNNVTKSSSSNLV